MKPIAQQLNIKEFPFRIKDAKGNQIYYETAFGDWYRREFNSKGNQIYFENSIGYWEKQEFDSKGNLIYYENSTGYWVKKEFDSEGNAIYVENSNGEIIDNRPKVVELTMDEIASKLGIDVNLLKIKK